jgi:hypothetical protein
MTNVLLSTSILAIYGLWNSSEIVLLTNCSQYVLSTQITRSTFHIVFVLNAAIRIKIPPFDSELEIVLITDVNCITNSIRSFSLTWSVAPVWWWNNTKYLNKKELIPVPYTNMAAISLFWYTNMAAVTSDENDLF